MHLWKTFNMYNSPSLFSSFKYFCIFVQNHLPVASKPKLMNCCEENWKQKKLSLSVTHFLVKWNASMRTHINKIVFIFVSVTWCTETNHLREHSYITYKAHWTSVHLSVFVLLFYFWIFVISFNPLNVMTLMCHYWNWHLLHSKFWASLNKRFFFWDNINLLLIVSHRKGS